MGFRDLRLETVVLSSGCGWCFSLLSRSVSGALDQRIPESVALIVGRLATLILILDCDLFPCDEAKFLGVGCGGWRFFFEVVEDSTSSGKEKEEIPTVEVTSMDEQTVNSDKGEDKTKEGGEVSGKTAASTEESFSST
ncbi:hypothetical protein LINPERHAP1_LOCUS38040 [Linum perenne]